MAATLRKAVESVTDFVFPVSKSATDFPQQHLVQRGNEYVSNLPLQMSLYFNAFFFPCWWIVLVVMLEAKYSQLDTLYRIIIIAVIVVMTVIEVIRLYLGYLGNLSEQVPELAGFWLLTILLQLPLILFLLLNEDTKIMPLERAVNIVMTCFVVFEVIVGYFAIRYLVNYQVTKFHLQQFEDLDQIDNLHEDDGGYVNDGRYDYINDQGYVNQLYADRHGGKEHTT